MNIIITETFKKDFTKILRGKNDINIFSDKLKDVKLFHLKNPFNKFKLKISYVSIRGILIFEVNKNLIPIFIVKKTDKKYGMNLLITNEIKKLLELKYVKSLNDIKNNNFELL